MFGGDAVVPFRLAREARRSEAEGGFHRHERVDGHLASGIDGEAPEGVALDVEADADSADVPR